MKLRIKTVVLLLVFLSNYILSGLSPLCSVSASEEEPAVNISSCQELFAIPKKSKKTYILLNDLDCSGVTASPIENFRGIVEGNNFSISNLEVFPIFDRVIDSKINNLSLSNIELNKSSTDIAQFAIFANRIQRTELENIYLDNIKINIAEESNEPSLNFDYKGHSGIFPILVQSSVNNLSVNNCHLDSKRYIQNTGLVIGNTNHSQYQGVNITNSSFKSKSNKTTALFTGRASNSRFTDLHIENNELITNALNNSAIAFARANKSFFENINFNNNHLKLSSEESPKNLRAALFTSSFTNSELSNMKLANSSLDLNDTNLLNSGIGFASISNSQLSNIDLSAELKTKNSSLKFFAAFTDNLSNSKLEDIKTKINTEADESSLLSYISGFVYRARNKRANEEIQIKNVYSTGNLIHNEGQAGALLGFAQNINIEDAYSDIEIQSTLLEKHSRNIIGFIPKLRNTSIRNSYSNLSLTKNEIENRFDPLVFDFKELRVTDTFYNTELGTSKVTEATSKTSEELTAIFSQAFNYDPSEKENNTNFKPVLIANPTIQTVVKNQNAEIDLSESIDPDGDEFTMFVKDPIHNQEEFHALIDRSYKFSSDISGIHELSFYAEDSHKNISEDISVSIEVLENFWQKPYKDCEANECLEINFINASAELLEKDTYLNLIVNESQIPAEIDKEALTYKFILSGSQDYESEFKELDIQLEEEGDLKVSLETFLDGYKISSYEETINIKGVNQNPIADFTLSTNTITAEEILSLDASESKDPENSALEYHWDFGDGNTSISSAPNTQHSYLKEGEYTISLFVKDDRNKKSEVVSKNILIKRINTAPTANFNIDILDCKLTQISEDSFSTILGYDKEEKEFICHLKLNSASSDDHGIDKLNWHINGLSRALSYSEHEILQTIKTIGNIEINLEVNDEEGLSDRITKTLQVFESKPVAKATHSLISSNTSEGTAEYEFNSNESIAFGEGITYHWDFGDGSESDEKNPRHIYEKPEIYSPTLRLCKYCNDGDPNNDLEDSYSLDSIIVEKDIPLIGEINFLEHPSLEDSEAKIQTRSIGNFTEEEWQWIYKAIEFDSNGNLISVDKSSTVQNSLDGIDVLNAPLHFENPGHYTLVHKLDHKSILSETLTLLPNQIPVPKISLNFSPGSKFVSVSAEESFDTKATEIETYEWNFGDSTIKYGEISSHNYSSNGIFYITLTVTDSEGKSSSAFSKPIIIQDLVQINNPTPTLNAQFESEDSTETIASDEIALLKTIDLNDASSSNTYKQLKNIEHNGPNRVENTEILDRDNSGGKFCSKSDNQRTSISSYTVKDRSSLQKGIGSKVIYLNGSYFCRKNHSIEVNGKKRNSSFINSNTIAVRLTADDLNTNSLNFKYKHQGNNNNRYTASRSFSIPNKSTSYRSINVSNGSSNTLRLASYKNNFNLLGDTKHYYSNTGPIFTQSSQGRLTSQGLSFAKVPNTKAKIVVHTNGNAFNRFRLKYNNQTIIDRSPNSKKFRSMVSDEFSPQNGTANLEIIVDGGRDLKIQDLQFVSSPASPNISQINVNSFIENKKQNITVNFNTSSNSKIKAALINKQTQKGQHAGKYKILSAVNYDSRSSNVSFRFPKFKKHNTPGTLCAFWYVNNGSNSNDTIASYLKNNVFSKYNQKLAQSKHAFISQSEYNYLLSNALSSNHGACFENTQTVNVNWQDSNPLLAQVHPSKEIRLGLNSNLASHIKANWKYALELENLNTGTRIDLPVSNSRSEEVFFRLNTNQYLGNWKLIVNMEAKDPYSENVYVSSLSKALTVLEDKAPIAEIVLKDPKKSILKTSTKNSERAELDGSGSYDPNKAVDVHNQIDDGIQSFFWQTQYRSLENPNYQIEASPYPSSNSNYFIGPSTKPGIYRATLEVRDRNNKSHKVESNSIQIIEPSQKLITSLNVKGNSKIFELSSGVNEQEIEFKALIKAAGAKSDRVRSLSCSLDFGDGTVENFSIPVNKIKLNKFIDMEELKSIKHNYALGEYLPKLTARLEFEDSYTEEWTVEAGTVSVVDLSNLILFQPYIKNLEGRNSFSTPFTAEFGVKDISIIGHQVTGFTWDYGDGESSIYSGSSPNEDFYKSNVTDKSHQYSNPGEFKPSLTVSIDNGEIVTYNLKTLNISDFNTDANFIKSFSLNGQSEEISITDNDLIEVRTEFFDEVKDFDELIVYLHEDGKEYNIFYDSVLDQVSSSDVLNLDLSSYYLPPRRNYKLKFIARKGELTKSESFEFGVRRPKNIGDNYFDLDALIDLVEKEVSYTNEIYHEIPVLFYKQPKSIKVYNNDELQKEYLNLTSRDKPDLYAELYDDSINNIHLEIVLRNGKTITTPKYSLILDVEDPIIDIESPTYNGAYMDNKIFLSGTIEEDNLEQIYYRVNQGNYIELPYEADLNEDGVYNFEHLIAFDTNNSPVVNLIEVMVADKAGNTVFEGHNIQLLSGDDFSITDGKYVVKDGRDKSPNFNMLVENNSPTPFFNSSTGEWNFISGNQFHLGFNTRVTDLESPQGSTGAGVVCRDDDRRSVFGIFVSANDLGITVANGNNTNIAFGLTASLTSSRNNSRAINVMNYLKSSDPNTFKIKSDLSPFVSFVSAKLGIDVTDTLIINSPNTGGDHANIPEYPEVNPHQDYYNFIQLGPFNSVLSDSFFDLSSDETINPSLWWRDGSYFLDYDVRYLPQHQPCSGTSNTLGTYDRDDYIVITGDPQEIHEPEITLVEPDILFYKHDIENLEAEFDVNLITAAGVDKFSLVRYDDDNRKYITVANAEFSFLEPFTPDTNGTEKARLKLSVKDLPISNISGAGTRYQIRVRDESRNFYLAAEDTPPSYVIAELEDVFPDDVSEDIVDKEKDHTSLDEKQIKLYIYHISDDLTKPSDIDLSLLKITKNEVDGDEKLVYDGAPVNTNDSDLDPATDFFDFQFVPEESELLGEDDKYPGFYKTTFIANDVIIKEAGEFNIQLDLSHVFADAKSRGEVFDPFVPQKADDYYTVDPYVIDLNNVELGNDKRLFFETFYVTPRRVELKSYEFLLEADYDFEDELDTNDLLSVSFEYLSENEFDSEGEAKLIDSRIQYGNTKPENVKLEPKLIDEQSIVFPEDKKIHFNLEFDIEKQRSILIKQAGSARVGPVPLFRLPLSIVLKSIFKQDVELKGLLESKNGETKVGIMDYPIFFNKDNRPHKAKLKYTKNGYPKIALRMNHQNVVPKKIDPLDLEVKFYDDFDNPITDSIILSSIPSAKRKNGDVSRIKTNTQKDKTKTNTKATLKTSNLLGAMDFKYQSELDKISINEDDTGTVPARMSLKLLRNKGRYLNEFKNEGFLTFDQLDDYYFVEDGDPLREIFIDLEMKQKRNFCAIIDAEGARHQNLTVHSEAELKNLEIYFESDSKKNKTRVWLTDSDASNSYHNFYSNLGQVSYYDFLNSNRQRLDFRDYSSNEVLKISKGYLDLSNFFIPLKDPFSNEQKDRFKIEFAVGPHTASIIDPENAFCTIDYELNSVAPSEIVITKLDNGDKVKQGDNEFKFHVHTIPPEAIYGLSIADEEGRAITGIIDENNKAMDIHLATFYPEESDLGEHTLTFTVTYFENSEAKTVSVNRIFVLVDENEPDVVFGNNNDLGTDSRYPNVIFGTPGSAYRFNTQIAISGLSDSSNTYTFKLKNMTVDQELLDSGEDPEEILLGDNDVFEDPLSTDTEKIYNLSVDLNFHRIENINVYRLEVYENDRETPLSQYQEFLLTDNPELEVTNVPSVLSFDENNLATLNYSAELKHKEGENDSGFAAFPRRLNVEYRTYVNDDKNQAVDQEFSGLLAEGNQFTDLKQDFEVIDPETANLNLSVTNLTTAKEIETLIKLTGRGSALIGVGEAAAFTPPGLIVLGLYVTYEYKEEIAEVVCRSFDGWCQDLKTRKLKYENDILATNSDIIVDYEIKRNGQVVATDDDGYWKGDGNYSMTFYASKLGDYDIDLISYNKGIEQQENIAHRDVTFSDGDSFKMYKFPTELEEIPAYYKEVNLGDLGSQEDLVELMEVQIQFVKDNSNGSDSDKATSLEPDMKVFFADEFDNDSTGCLRRELGASMEIYVSNWLTKGHKDLYRIYKNGLQLGVGDDNKLTAAEIQPGHLVVDFIRIKPQIEGASLRSIGYCESLTDHIRRVNTEGGFGKDNTSIRMFESKNQGDGSIKDHHQVFWLSKERLRHIFRDHGSQLAAPFDDKGRFSTKSEVISVMEKTILNSENPNSELVSNPGSKNVGVSSDEPGVTKFQKKFNLVEPWEHKIENVQDPIKTNVVYIVVDPNADPVKFRGKITSQYPLANTSGFQGKTIEGGPVPDVGL